MTLKKEFREIEKELEKYSSQQLSELREDAKRMTLEEWMKKHPVVKRLFILIIRVLAILPFTGPITDIALNGAAEILERE